MISPAPKVSIVIVTLLRDPAMLGRCLAALGRNVPPSLTHEVVILVQGTSGMAALPSVGDNVRVLNSRVNLGFGSGCNRAAKEARGEFLVFLNDDAEVEPGWLEALVETASKNPEAGAVGSLILFPNGTIQEAGSVLWSDGSTLGVDRGEPAASASYQYLRRVDYCSASSLLVRKGVFDAVGGFDERYFPAYYEDVDLCLAIQRLGKWILFQPRSRVVHHESQSTSYDYRTFLMLRNRRQLVEKWSEELAARPPAEPTRLMSIDRAIWRARRLFRRVLIIDDRPPQQEAGSGFNLLFDAIGELTPLRYAFSVAATDVVDGDLERLSELGVEVLREPIVDVLKKPHSLFDVVVVSRPNNLERYLQDIRRYQSHAEIVYLAEALYSRRIERQARLSESPEEKNQLLAEAHRMWVFESEIPSRVDRIVAVSFEEAEFLRQGDGRCPVYVISPLAARPSVTTPGFVERSDLLFVPGWLAGETSPNTDALHWFADRVLPLVRNRIPGVKLLVTGANPPPSVRRRIGGGVTLLGGVPDLAAAYASTRVVVVPTRYGSGVKIKCAEALRHGVPVVATSVGAEGMGLEGSSAVDIADDPGEFAERIVELYTSPERWKLRREAILSILAKVASEASASWSQALDPRWQKGIGSGNNKCASAPGSANA